MRRIKRFIFTMMALATAAFTLQSCLDDDDDNGYITIEPDTNVGVVTLKPDTEAHPWWIQLSDSTIVTCSNIKEFPLKEKKEQRAYIYFKFDSEPSFTADIKSITVTHIDTILTKQLVPNLESEEANSEAYGNDPVDIVKSDLETLAEDGYMNIRFRTNWTRGSVHRVNLVRVADEEGLATFCFHHDADGDTNGVLGDGMVAFYLDLEKDIDRTPREIKIKWKSFTGDKSVKFKYIPRNDD
ncbi:MAG: NigD-like protein [Prevotella sp.]